MGETCQINSKYNLLINNRNKISKLKMGLTIIFSILVIANIYTLFFKFYVLKEVFLSSISLQAFISLTSAIYIHFIKHNCKKLEYLIYQEQKL